MEMFVCSMNVKIKLMKRIYNLLISMQMMAFLLIMYAMAMGIATFVENDYGSAVAKNMIYNSWWFELIHMLLLVNMIGSIFKYKFYKRPKFSILLFHVAFIIILIGAGITRYISYEGMMHIREGEAVSKIYSSESYIQMNLKFEDYEEHFSEEVFITPLLKSGFSKNFDVKDKELSVELVNIIPNPREIVIEVLGGKTIIEIVFPVKGRMDSHFLSEGKSLGHGDMKFALNAQKEGNTAQFYTENSKLYLQSDSNLNMLSMSGGLDSVIMAGKKHEIRINQLYLLAGERFVVSKFYNEARISYIPGETAQGIRYFALEFDLKSDDITKKLELVSSHGALVEPVVADINGIKLDLTYGVKEIPLPFEVKLRKFDLDRYPGSESPSSYASDVTVIDKEADIEMDYRIYMNNVLDYKGYRFFQSSYDADEKGTILSVNRDKAGTNVTYIGYFLLALGMFWSIFNKNSYFIKLLRGTSEIRNARKGLSSIILFFFLFGAQNSFAQSTQHIDAAHANEFGRLFVQDNGGRIKPYNTLTNELLRKMARKEKLLDLNSNQVFLGMLFNSPFWKNVKMIKLKNPELKKILGTEDTHVSFNDLVNIEKQVYVLRNYIDDAVKKEPSQRNMFDKDVIAVDERLNIAYQIYSGNYIHVFPFAGDNTKKWLSPNDYKFVVDSVEREFVANIFPSYYQEILEAKKSGDWTKAKAILDQVSDYQQEHASDFLPSETKLDYEIQYINTDIFNEVYKYYGLIGFIFLIFLFVGILRPKMNVRVVKIISSILLGLLFLAHTYGLGVRWYVSGHAPWSNGYESMIYIAWATMLAGLLFMKRSSITLAATALLASITLMVAHLSWMDPQITNLVPVLKSYWLTIHVSVITASYGFLALGALLGFLSLCLMVFKNSSNFERINLTIKELTNVNQMTIIAGLYLLTIGSFLGGVWANESWGRYWGWDPKETWSLITIVIYTFVSHTRFIPSLKSPFSFNLLALLSFSSVMMTYFGVNYYLSGLHSYASGDPVPLPNFIYYTIGVIATVAIIAFIRNSNNKNLENIKKL